MNNFNFTPYPGIKPILEYLSKGREIKTHSKEVSLGDVFVAQPGVKSSGSDFIPEALSRGAAYVLTEISPDNFSSQDREKIVQVDDVRLALGELAKNHYQTGFRRCTLIGVTGTNGKTTLCYLLEHLFKCAGLSVGVMGTISYRWPGHAENAGLTTPDCLKIHQLISRMDDSGVDYVFMEVSSHALEQKRTAGLNFDLGVFTNLSQDHLDYHEDMENYFQAKAKLFSQAQEMKAVLNLDDPYGRKLYSMHKGQRIGFGLLADFANREDCLFGKIARSDKSGLALRMSFQNYSWKFFSRLIGRHNASNLLAAQAVGLACGLEKVDLAALEKFSGIPGRLQRVENSLGLDIFIDYAHTPDALEKVLVAAKELQPRRLVVVFGCGGDRDKKKRPLMGEVVARYTDLAFLTSDNPRQEEPEEIMSQVLPGLSPKTEVVWEVDRYQAIGKAVAELKTKDLLIIAGKGHEEYQEVKGERKFFSDYAVVLEWISRLYKP